MKRQLEAFKNCRTLNWPSDQIHPTNSGVVWMYHGNIIAQWTEKVVQVNWCGWFTQSTTKRINAIADAFGKVRPNADKNMPHTWHVLKDKEIIDNKGDKYVIDTP